MQTTRCRSNLTRQSRGKSSAGCRQPHRQPGPVRNRTCPCHPGRPGCWGHRTLVTPCPCRSSHSCGAEAGWDHRTAREQALALGRLLPGTCGLEEPSDLGLYVSISSEQTLTPGPQRICVLTVTRAADGGGSGTEMIKSLHLQGLTGKAGPGLKPAVFSHGPHGSRETEAQRTTCLKVLLVARVVLGVRPTVPRGPKAFTAGLVNTGGWGGRSGPPVCLSFTLTATALMRGHPPTRVLKEPLLCQAPLGLQVLKQSSFSLTGQGARRPRTQSSLRVFPPRPESLPRACWKGSGRRAWTADSAPVLMSDVASATPQR